MAPEPAKPVEPLMAHSNEEGADDAAKRDRFSRHAAERQWTFSRFCAQPQAGDPYPLPGEEIKSAGLLQGNLQMGNENDRVVDQITQAALRQKPDRKTRGENAVPSPPDG